MIDPRCLIDHLNSISALAQSNQHAVQQLRRQLSDMQEIMIHGLCLNQQLLKDLSLLSTSVRRMENHLLGDRPKKVSPWSHPSNVTPFTVSAPSKNKSASEVFVSFFYEDYRVGFELDKKSEAWKEDMDMPEKNRIRDLFGKIKYVVKIFLMHSYEFPLIPDDPTKKYKEVLRRTATAAEE
ncbi:hypothetical protein IV203_038337 [Nitzschia inconspicua]|uniref:Uncharacterized protein n=1 Tax=Nitzschia inconspicua TaxID=303405 RepID=A0A9K3LME2_9STRA|nr:hypothetical protein IV203_038337 [Nitzschia inconspicua]